MNKNVPIFFLGVLLIIIGIGMIIVFWSMDTSVSVERNIEVMGDTYSISKKVENLGLMNRQQNGIMTGCCLVLFGVGLLIVDELKRLRKTGIISEISTKKAKGLKQLQSEEQSQQSNILLKVGETFSSPRKLTFECPQCQASLSVDSEHAGKEIQCPNCEAKIEVPMELT